MRTMTNLSVAITVLCFGVFLEAQVMAQPAAVIKPAVATPQLLGAKFTVEISVSNVQKLFGASFELRYTNTNLVKLAAPASSSVTAGPFLGSDVVFFANLDTTAGKIGIAISRKAGQASLRGTGVIASVKFVSLLSAPNNTPVTFSLHDVTTNDSLGNAIALAASDSTIAVRGLLVYPGDTNNDKIVNQADVLPIGVHFNKTGPVRPNATLFWPGQAVFPWTPEASTYADANGNGLVNQADVLPIGLNWGRTRSAPPLIVETDAALPILNKSNTATIGTAATGDTNPGQEFEVGVVVDQVTNLFGISFELIYAPTALVDPQSSGFGSFLGNDVVFFTNIDKNVGKVSIGITRKAGQGGVNGSGMIAGIKMRVSNQAVRGQAIIFKLQNVTANDPNAQPTHFIFAPSKFVIVSVESRQNETLPTAFSLQPNLPNPLYLSSANAATTMKYELPQPAETRVEIYDILGKHVRTLVNQRQQPGRYSVVWDGRDETGRAVATGVYVYQLHVVDPAKGGTGNFVQSRKLMVLR